MNILSSLINIFKKKQSVEVTEVTTELVTENVSEEIAMSESRRQVDIIEHIKKTKPNI